MKPLRRRHVYSYMARLLLALVAALALAVPAAALAAPPWSPPVTVPGALGSTTPLVVTPSGTAVLLAALSRDAAGSTGTPSELAQLGPGGQPALTQPVNLAAGLLATYAKTRVVVAGSTLVDGTITDRSHVTVGLGAPGSVALHGLSGSTGQRVFGVAGNVRGDVAVLTGDASHVRTLYLRRAGAAVFRVALRIAVGNRARGATVALGPKGDALVVWEDDHVVFARHLGPTGHPGPTHRIGDGAQSDLQAAIDDAGRFEIALKTQRVNEGESSTPAIVRFATAAPGHGFGPQRTVETVGGSVGTGRFVAPPAVRLLPEAGGRALLAWTGFQDGHFVVRAAEVSGGHRGAPQTLSPATEDAVLGDAAVGPGGAALVAWRAGVLGSDPVPGAMETAFASVRAAGATAFAAPEQISDSGETVPVSPFAALDPVSGRALVAYSSPDAVRVSVRP